MPLGWNISVYRQADGGTSPAAFGAKQGTRLASWQTGIRGLTWLEALVAEGRAIDLGGDGYPLEYTAMAADLLSTLQGPPDARDVWLTDRGDIITPEWLGKTTLDLKAIESCSPSEWLLVQAWDES